MASVAQRSPYLITPWCENELKASPIWSFSSVSRGDYVPKSWGPISFYGAITTFIPAGRRWLDGSGIKSPYALGKNCESISQPATNM